MRLRFERVNLGLNAALRGEECLEDGLVKASHAIAIYVSCMLVKLELQLHRQGVLTHSTLLLIPS